LRSIYNLQTRKVSIHRIIRNRMCSTQLPCRGICPPKNNRNLQLTARHIPRFGSMIEDLISGKYSKVKSHKLNNRPQPVHCCSSPNSGKTKLRNSGINHPFRPIFVEESFRHLIRVIIFLDLFTHYKDILVICHFPITSSTTCSSQSYLSHSLFSFKLVVVK